MSKNSNKVGAREFNDEQVMRLGRTLRRFSRTSRDLMKALGIEEEDVKIPRKKKRPAAAKKPNEQTAAD